MKTYRFVSVRITCVTIMKRSIFAVYFFQLYMKKKKLIVLSKMTKNVKISFAHKHFYRVLRRNRLFPALICIQTSGLVCRVCACTQFSTCVWCMSESRCQTAFHSIGLHENHLSVVMFNWFEFCNWQLLQCSNDKNMGFLLRISIVSLFNIYWQQSDWNE